MAIQILKEDAQVFAELVGGKIIANKPIGFPQENGRLKPYSNLFYFSNFVADYDTQIPEQRNQGFEIIYYVIKGTLDTQDSQSKQWTRLGPGELQVIKSGSGFVHTKAVSKGTQYILIWLDPNLRQSLQREGVYSNFNEKSYNSLEHERYKEIILAGEGSNVSLMSESVRIMEFVFFQGLHVIKLNDNYIYSCYMIKGDAEINSRIVDQDDYFVIFNESQLSISNSKDIRILILENPTALTYTTYFVQNKDKYESKAEG